MFWAITAVALGLLSSPDYKQREWAEGWTAATASPQTVREVLGSCTDPEAHSRLVRVRRAVTIREIESAGRYPEEVPAGWFGWWRRHDLRWYSEWLGGPDEFIPCPWVECDPADGEGYSRYPTGDEVRAHIKAALIHYALRTGNVEYAKRCMR